ncbi:MAG: hypothetical protein JSU08_14275 [Acidobacteria bacterium]|nr:hypothetical protein [Acidobacteriota bacterium]
MSKPVGVVFIHGLAKKPSPEKLEEIWLDGLGRDNPRPDCFAAPNPGVNLEVRGVPYRFNYYADVFYGTDYETEFASYYEIAETKVADEQGLKRIESELVPPTPTTPREKAFLESMEAKLDVAAVPTLAIEPEVKGGTPIGPGGSAELEIASWLPASVKQAIIKKAAMEAFYFLFNKEYVRPDGARFQVRDELRARLLKDLAEIRKVADKVVIVSHSMGTMVAYDVLRNCPTCTHVDTLITLGSPLGIQEVQDELRAVDAKAVDFPAKTLDRWINVYDPLDPVCGADPQLANDYTPVSGRTVVDIKESNWGSWRHTITHYFSGTQLRAQLGAVLGIGK